MVYRAIGIMSGSSLDGLDIAFAEFQENAGKWNYEILKADCLPYSHDWIKKLRSATLLSALDYQLLHVEYGHYIGEQVNRFIEKNNLQYQIALIASHGHTTFHIPEKNMTAQLGDGAAIAAETGLPVVTDLRAMDLALGGQGAPIVPIGEKLLLGDYDFFLNLGGIANISRNAERYIAFDVCPANRVLNMLANELGKEYDEDGKIAASGNVNTDLLEKLSALDYYKKPFPKSLANEFGTDIIYPLIRGSGCEIQDALRTYVQHMVIQIRNSIQVLLSHSPLSTHYSQLVTGGGAMNSFLIQQLKEALKDLNVEVIVPDKFLINFKEALIMAFMGVLRWRQENNVLSSVTGAKKNSIGGAIWTGQEA